jgi:hypothetical protein
MLRRISGVGCELLLGAVVWTGYQTRARFEGCREICEKDLWALDAKDAWKISTRGIRDEEARQRAVVSGQAALGLKVLEMVSVIA